MPAQSPGLYLGIVLNKESARISVATATDNWDDCYASCKKEYPDLPCICINIMAPDQVKPQLMEFFLKNGMELEEATDAVNSLGHSLNDQITMLEKSTKP